ncbi:reticulon-4-interacting protein 1 homolog, mitochondrial-like [Antedon mediterranea]|uniref:reticulon-4-interacting protein 1 homolog, mitochondrial-like n=1 Tax=Antedon mediterranea TaxID=105859 RepID=UPI003AF75976
MFNRVLTLRTSSVANLSNQIVRIEAHLLGSSCKDWKHVQQRSVHGLAAPGPGGGGGGEKCNLSRFEKLQYSSSILHPIRRLSCTQFAYANMNFIKNVHIEEVDSKNMLAWQIHNYGKDNFHLVEKPVPIITKQDELLIKVYASSINPIDLRMQEGYGSVLFNKSRRCAPGDEFPLILGRDCSGVVVDVGKNVKGLKKGDKVWAAVNQIQPGSHAQYVVVNHNEVSHMPESISFVEAASLPYVIATVWSALYAVARFRPNKDAIAKSVLIHGGSGGIGSFAIQLVKAWNGRATTTCGTDAVEMVKKLGASRVYDYRLSNYEESIMKTGGFDLILDTIGGETEKLSMKLLKKGSQMVSLVSPFLTEMDRRGAVLGALSASTIMFKKAMAASKQGGKFRWAFANPNAQGLETVAKLVNEGQIKPVIDRVYTFQEVPEAFEQLRKGHARGKIVIDMGEEKIIPTSSDDFYKDS